MTIDQLMNDLAFMRERFGGDTKILFYDVPSGTPRAVTQARCAYDAEEQWVELTSS